MRVIYSSPTATTLGTIVKNICLALAQKISFGYATDNSDSGQNIDGQWATFTSPATANTTFAVTLTSPMNRTPVGYIVMKQSAAGSLYVSGTTWTESGISLKCSAASVAFTIMVI